MDQVATRRKMTAEQIDVFIKKHFPQAGMGTGFKIEAVEPMSATLRLVYSDQHLQPGGTISGPAMFTLADLAMYVAILGEIGVGDDPEAAGLSVGALSVTTNLNINFLRKPAQRDLIGTARLMKLGQRLAVGDVWMTSEGESDPVAHATATYSVPPR